MEAPMLRRLFCRLPEAKLNVRYEISGHAQSRACDDVAVKIQSRRRSFSGFYFEFWHFFRGSFAARFVCELTDPFPFPFGTQLL